MGGRTGKGLSGTQAWPLALSLPFLAFGFGLRVAECGYADCLLALGIVPHLLQSALVAFGVQAPITWSPAPKPVLAVGSKLLLPGTWHPAQDALRLGFTGTFAETHSAAVLLLGLQVHSMHSLPGQGRPSSLCLPSWPVERSARVNRACGGNLGAASHCGPAASLPPTLGHPPRATAPPF